MKSILGKQSTIGYILVLPVLAYIAAFVAYPFFTAIWLSFTDKYIGRPAHFIGLTNYVRLIPDRAFWRSILNTFIYTSGALVFKLLLGLGMALALNQRFRGRGIIRALLILPWVCPTIVTALSWRWIFDDMNGLLNHVLTKLGLISYPVAWLGVKTLAMPAVILANVWRGSAFFGICLLAGLQSIPKELYQAAEVDGASVLGRFRYITLPGLRNVLMLIALLSTIWTINDFALVWNMTEGGPSHATELFTILTFQIGFDALRLGSAMAISFFVTPFLFVLIIVISNLILGTGEE